MSQVLIAPSILAADFSQLGEDIRTVEQAGADWLHVDVMDGHFVPNLSMGPAIVKSLNGKTKLPMDVHLMIKDPVKYAATFAEAGAASITFHQEAVRYPEVAIKDIKAMGVKVGMSLKPKTPARLAIPYLKDLDVILIMTVEPGFGGQSFMADMIPKIVEISEYIKKNKLDCLVQVDGGIDPKTAPLTVKAGANVLVAGSAIFKNPDPVGVVKKLKSNGL